MDDFQNELKLLTTLCCRDGSFAKLAERFMAKEKQMMTAQGL